MLKPYKKWDKPPIKQMIYSLDSSKNNNICIYIYKYVIIYILRYANDDQEKSFEQVNWFRISSIHCM